MDGVRWRKNIVHLTTFITVLAITGTGSSELPVRTMEIWADRLGNHLYEVCRKSSALDNIKQSYRRTEPTSERLDLSRTLSTSRREIRDFLSDKKTTLESLVHSAQQSYRNAPFENTPQMDGQPLEDGALDGINTTAAQSESDDIPSWLSWSETLNPIFRDTHLQDPSLSRQVFVSPTGISRSYTAGSATSTVEDSWGDVSSQWYKEAATLPKDVVVLMQVLDASLAHLAVRAAESVLAALTDGDYVNIIKVAQPPRYAKPCLAGGMAPATPRNKEMFLEFVGRRDTQNSSTAFAQALEEALALVNQTNARRSTRQANCGRMLIVISDDVRAEFTRSYEKLDLAGLEAQILVYHVVNQRSRSQAERASSCDSIVPYKVVSGEHDLRSITRDIIFSSTHRAFDDGDQLTPVTWSKPYLDQKRPRNVELVNLTKENVLPSVTGSVVFTIAKPVFGARNFSVDSSFLGVMGLSIPLSSLKKRLQLHKLGAFGSAMITDNNGNVILHTEFIQNSTYPELIYDLNIAEIEQGLDGLLDTFYADIVAGYTGRLRLSVNRQEAGQGRVTSRRMTYRYTTVERTPLSLVVAFPSDRQLHKELQGHLLLSRDSDLTLFTGYRSRTKLAHWQYCRFDAKETARPFMEVLSDYLEAARLGLPAYQERCDGELMSSLWYDVSITHSIYESWMGYGSDGVLNQERSRSYGIQLHFIGTKAGLTRYLYNVVENVTDPEFPERNRDTLESSYYQRAAASGSGTFTFFVDDLPDSRPRSPEDVIVTAVTPVTTEGAVGAVLGVQMTFQKFTNFLYNHTHSCGWTSSNNVIWEDICNVSCASAELNCYLLDENAYMVFSENISEVGQPFETTEAHIMQHLSKADDKPTNAGQMKFFKRVAFNHYHRPCSNEEGYTAWTTCRERQMYYELNRDTYQPQQGDVEEDCGDPSCQRSYAAFRVIKTNLVLVAVETGCHCAAPGHHPIREGILDINANVTKVA